MGTCLRRAQEAKGIEKGYEMKRDAKEHSMITTFHAPSNRYEEHLHHFSLDEVHIVLATLAPHTPLFSPLVSSRGRALDVLVCFLSLVVVPVLQFKCTLMPRCDEILI